MTTTKRVKGGFNQRVQAGVDENRMKANRVYDQIAACGCLVVIAVSSLVVIAIYLILSKG